MKARVGAAERGDVPGPETTALRTPIYIKIV